MTKGLFIEPPMTEAEAAARVTPGERAAAQEFLRERRRREFLTWRAVVRRELGDDVPIAYDEAGAPVVPGREVHIGVSHCPGRVAVCISDGSRNLRRSLCSLHPDWKENHFSHRIAPPQNPEHIVNGGSRR